MKPNIGMVCAVAAPITNYPTASTPEYGDGFVVSEARGATLTWETADGEFYGDDILLDSDMGIRGYTLDFESAGVNADVRANLLGELKIKGSDNQYFNRINASEPPFVGFGFVRVMRSNAGGNVVETYEAWVFHKMKFRLNNEETRTKEKNIEWRVPTLHGKGYGLVIDNTGKPSFADHKDFTSLSAAIGHIRNALNCVEGEVVPGDGGEEVVETEPAGG